MEERHSLEQSKGIYNLTTRHFPGGGFNTCYVDAQYTSPEGLKHVPFVVAQSLSAPNTTSTAITKDTLVDLVTQAFKREGYLVDYLGEDSNRG